MKKKSKTITFIGIAVVVTLIGISYRGMQQFRKNNVNTAALSYAALEKTDLTNSIYISGVIESKSVRTVYAIENYPIKEVLVKEGDVVKAGDVLAILDTESLELDIQQTHYSIANAEGSLQEEQKNRETNIKNAAYSLENAKITLDKRRLSYETSKNQYENGTNTELRNAQNTIETLLSDLEVKKEEFAVNQTLFEAGAISEDALKKSQNSLNNTRISYENAVIHYDNLKIRIENELKQMEMDVKSAQIAYENAVDSLETAKNKSTSNTANNINSQKVNLEKQESRLENGRITAPIDGTITMVNGKVGGTPAGILFIIEDMSDLVVTTSVKEFDIGNVTVGQEVVIKTEGTGDQELSGTISYIAPTAKKDGSGSTLSTSNVEFEAVVDITDIDPRLRIGMNARMNIILERKSDVFAVSYDSILYNENGESVIQVLKDDTIREIPIEVGLDADIYIEVSGEELQEGMLVLLAPSSATVEEGSRINQMMNRRFGR